MGRHSDHDYYEGYRNRFSALKRLKNNLNRQFELIWVVGELSKSEKINPKEASFFSKNLLQADKNRGRQTSLLALTEKSTALALMTDYTHSFAFLIVKRFSYSLSNYFLEFIWEQFHDGHRKIKKSRDLQCITSGLVFKRNPRSIRPFIAEIQLVKVRYPWFSTNFRNEFRRKSIRKMSWKSRIADFDELYFDDEGSDWPQISFKRSVWWFSFDIWTN